MEELVLSVIIPTMWVYDPFVDFLKTLTDIECIGEFIIINNSKENQPNDSILNHPKIKIVTPESNLYVAPSWNLGASLAQFETLAFLSDDLIVDTKIFKKVDDFNLNDVKDEIGMICILSKYLDDPNYNKFYSDGEIDIRYVHGGEVENRPAATGMGNLFFVKKKDWKDIPHVKIFHGELLQWKRLDKIKKNYVVTNCYNDTPWHATWTKLSQNEETAEAFRQHQKDDQEYCDKIEFCFE